MMSLWLQRKLFGGGGGGTVRTATGDDFFVAIVCDETE
jgi:hypothetical protein